jgi:hypothetical protein
VGLDDRPRESWCPKYKLPLMITVIHGRFIIVNMHFLEKGKLCFYYGRTTIFGLNHQWDGRYKVVAVNEL